MANRNRAEVRSAIHKRIRRKVRGSTERPRLAVYRSVNHIYAQLIDDDKAQTLAAASTTEKSLRGSSGGNIEAAKRVGQAIAERAQAAGISSVVFDRGGYLYHGRVRALTDAARAAGLNKNEIKEAEEAPVEEAKPAEAAKKNLIRVPLIENTLPHQLIGRFGAGRVLMKPASEGTGVIAGGAVRAVMRAAGVHDVRTKVLGSTNPHNVVRATFDGLLKMKDPLELARLRGKQIEDL